MDHGFKKKLMGLYDNEESNSRWGKRFPEAELKQIVRYGAMGEMGQNYYLFIYRDFYRDAGYYGSIIFLNKKDELDFPVTVMGVELDGQERIRNVYVKAALFFLKNEFQNTLGVQGSVKIVFDLAKERINPFIGESSVSGVAVDLESFDMDVAGQAIRFRETRLKKVSKTFETWGLKEFLQKMGAINLYGHEGYEGGVGEPLIKVKVGINLKSQLVDLNGEKHYYFQWVLLPLLSDGQWGSPQKISKSGFAKYEWVKDETEKNLWQSLEPFVEHMAYIDNQPGNVGFKINLLFNLYFKKIAQEILDFPDGLTFCQMDNNQKEYKELRKIQFNHVTLRFAPSLEGKKDYELRFFLSLTGVAGDVLDVMDRFEVILCPEGNTYIICTTLEGETWFGVPEECQRFYALFFFLKEKKTFHTGDFEEILAALQEIESEWVSIQRQPLKKYELTLRPIPVLNIYPPNLIDGVKERLVVKFNYDERVKGFVKQHPDKIVCTYSRDEDFENHCLSVLQKDGLLIRQMGLNGDTKAIYHYYEFRDNDPLKWLIERGGKYLEKGFRIFSVKWNRFLGNTTGGMHIKMESGLDWLQFTPVLRDKISGKEYELDMEGVDEHDQVVFDKEGFLHLVTKKEIEKLASLYRYGQRQGNVFRVPSKNYILINKLYDAKMEDMPEIREVLNTEKRLHHFDKIADYGLSEEFNGQLRGYQMEGFKWLSFLQDYGFSGCLADDMGLGKTVQTLALLQSLKTNGKLGTSMLVVPVSAIRNWEMEIEKFAPGLTYHRHIGVDRDKDTSAWGNWDLIISSYATLRNDIEIAKAFPLDYLILDESQNIKNGAAQISKAMKLLQAKNRLALSGTPVENNSLELWSLFDFLLPGFLGTLPWFVKEFAQPIEKDHDEERGDLLRRMIFPFILRRKKEDVAKELPEKIEIVSKLRMEQEQFDLYEETAKYFRGELEKEMAEKGVGGASIRILEGMLRLRQICLFPHLMDEKHGAIPSVKFNHLKDLLEDILAEGHKVLIFSQFVQVLEVIKTHCDGEGILYSYIDGSVNLSTRAKMIANFQDKEETRVFLLSLKAGGVALNLTAADYVIIFDPWWNPAVEAQAIDRSHRIGQTQNVMVYRMVVEGTIEEKMLLLQERKKSLMDNLITADAKNFKDLSRDDVLDLFKISAADRSHAF